jgi:hypothetical protein
VIRCMLAIAFLAGVAIAIARLAPPIDVVALIPVLVAGALLVIERTDRSTSRRRR